MIYFSNTDVITACMYIEYMHYAIHITCTSTPYILRWRFLDVCTCYQGPFDQKHVVIRFHQVPWFAWSRDPNRRCNLPLLEGKQ